MRGNGTLTAVVLVLPAILFLLFLAGEATGNVAGQSSATFDRWYAPISKARVFAAGAESILLKAGSKRVVRVQFVTNTSIRSVCDVSTALSFVQSQDTSVAALKAALSESKAPNTSNPKLAAKLRDVQCVTLNNYRQEQSHRSDAAEAPGRLLAVNTPRRTWTLPAGKDQFLSFELQPKLKGNLQDTDISETEAISLLYAILSDQLALLKYAGFIHLDLHPGNILLCNNASGSPTWALNDFGTTFPEEGEDGAGLNHRMFNHAVLQVLNKVDRSCQSSRAKSVVADVWRLIDVPRTPPVDTAQTLNLAAQVVAEYIASMSPTQRRQVIGVYEPGISRIHTSRLDKLEAKVARQDADLAALKAQQEADRAALKAQQEADRAALKAQQEADRAAHEAQQAALKDQITAILKHINQAPIYHAAAPKPKPPPLPSDDSTHVISNLVAKLDSCNQKLFEHGLRSKDDL